MKPKGRPKKYRIIKQDPRISQFSPRGKPGRPEEVQLTMDEYEAVRLADFEGIEQKKAAKSMRISQQTFSRVIKRARSLISDAIVNGKIIKIQGGYYVTTSRQNLPEK